MYIPAINPHPVPRWRGFILCVSCLLGFTAFAAGESGKRDFDLPSDLAVRTFKLFSEQSGRGLIADADLVRGIRTNPVQGQFSVREVLERMLAGTGLVAKEDLKNGAFVVHRETPRPNGQRAALQTASDRPTRQTRLPPAGIHRLP